MLSREFLFAVLLVSSVCPSERLETHDPNILLKRAERLAWLTDWYTATPIYRSAESGFQQRGDARGAMYAKFGRIRGEMQTLPLADISNEIGTDLDSPLARDDQRLRLRGLTIKGDIDLEWNVAAAQVDWEQARQLAKELGESAWEHRATGELGMIAFMRGDTGEARKLVEQAFRAAWWSDDVGAQLRYMGSIANGLLQAGYPESAMSWVDKALAFSQKHPDTGYPYVVRSTQALALLRLNRPEEAERVVNEALVYARAGDRRIKEVELLMMLADIATKRGRPEEATAYLEQAVSRARSGDVRRLLADAEGDLAHAYRERGDLTIAERYATDAIAHTEASGNLHNVWYRGTVEFRWFEGTLHAGKIKAYIQLVLAICARALNGRSAQSRRRMLDAQSARYDFRVFLLRLGLIGDEFKTARKHLLAPLPGDSAFKRGRPAPRPPKQDGDNGKGGL